MGPELDAYQPDAAGESAFRLAQECLAATVLSGRPTVGVGVVPGDGICLGALVHAGRLLVPEVLGTQRVFRRSTSGGSFAFHGAALVAVVALPAIDTVWRDATATTFLNRNVRLLLRAFQRAGVRATYLGRDWISAGKRPLAQIGVDFGEGGALVVEAWCTRARGLEIERAHLTDLARSITVRRGLASVSLEELDPASIGSFPDRLLVGLAEAFDATPRLRAPASALAAPRVRDAWSPLDRGATWLAPREVPIGHVDVARLEDGASWVGGDVLARVDALGKMTKWPPADADCIAGATWSDLEAIVARS